MLDTGLEKREAETEKRDVCAPHSTIASNATQRSLIFSGELYKFYISKSRLSSFLFFLKNNFY